MNSKDTYCVGYLSAGPRVSTNPDAELTGARTHVISVMNAFKKLGWGVKPFIVGDRMPRRISGSGSEELITQNRFFTFLTDIARIILGYYNSRVAWRKMHQDVDIVYERLASMQTLGKIFQSRDIPWILESNSIYFKESTIDRKSVVLATLARKIEVDAYQQCSLIVTVTQNLKELIVEASGVPNDKVIVIPNGVDPDVFNPDAHVTERYFPNLLTIGFVGALYEWQALDLLFKAVKELKADGILVAVVVVGDGQMYATWQQNVKDLGIEEQVKFTGRVKWQDVPQYINGFDICFSGHKVAKANASHEGSKKVYMSPLKIYEYMSMCKPVIASSFEDTDRVIVDGETGFLFETENLSALKEALKKANENILNLNQMGKKARTHIIEQHSWENKVKGLIDIMKERQLI